MTALKKQHERQIFETAGEAWRAEAWSLSKLAGPLILTALSQMAINTTDIVMIGWLGAEALAAAVLAGHFYGLCLYFAMGVMAAVAPIVAQALGARKRRMVRRALRQGFWVALALTLPLGLVVWQGEAVLLLFGQKPALAADAEIYLRALVLGFFQTLCYVALSHFLSAHSRPRAVLVVTLIAIPLNALGNYALIFGNFGLPRLELAGAGYSSAMTESFLFLSLLGFVLIDRRFRRYHLLGRIWRPDWPRFREIFRIGLPIGLTHVSEIGLFLAAALLLGLIGTDELAGHAIALQCAAISYMVPLGLAQACTVRVGLAVGRRDPGGVVRAAFSALCIGCSFMLLPALFFWFGSPLLVSWFLDLSDPENLAAAGFAVSFLAAAAIFQIADGGQALAAGALRGLKDTRGPMVIALVGYWICGLGCAWWLGFGLELGGIGVWYGLAAGLAFAFVAMLARLLLKIGARDLEGRWVFRPSLGAV